uniref:focal adhesion kinase 1-like isoform X2 n=1 Tax=Myxine glutinosa TaxID=7769 RepID=UPI00358F6A81
MFVATHNGPQFVCGQAPPGDGPMGQRGTYAIQVLQTLKNSRKFSRKMAEGATTNGAGRAQLRQHRDSSSRTASVDDRSSNYWQPNDHRRLSTQGRLLKVFHHFDEPLMKSYSTVRYREQSSVLEVVESLLEGRSLQVWQSCFAISIRHVPTGHVYWLTSSWRMQIARDTYECKHPADEWRYELHLRFLPQDFLVEFSHSEIMLNYLYQQVWQNYQKQAMNGVEKEMAFELACLEIRRKFYSISSTSERKSQKSLLEHQEKEMGGLTSVLPPLLSVQIKPKLLRKHMEQVGRHFDSLNPMQCMLGSLQRLQRCLLFHRKTYICYLDDQQVKVHVVVGPDVNVSYSADKSQTKLALLVEFGAINSIVFSELTNGTLLELNARGLLKPVLLTVVEDSDGSDLANLIDGFVRLHQGLNYSSIFQKAMDDNSDYAEVMVEQKFDETYRCVPGSSMELDRQRIKMGYSLHNGRFCDIMHGLYREKDQHEPQDVAVKECKDQTSNDRLLREADIMRQLHHPHILMLVGIVSMLPVWIVTEFCQEGQLQAYLENHQQDLETFTLLRYTWQISVAFSYLESKKIIHRDVTARNMLVATPKCIKLGGFGFACLVDTHGSCTDERALQLISLMSVQWMAPESISSARFSTFSDIWMFGMCMWEIMSYGASPFHDRPYNDVLQAVESGERPMLPKTCPPKLFGLMSSCWSLFPAQRPPFHQLKHNLSELYKEERKQQQETVDQQKRIISVLPRLSAWDSLSLTNEMCETPDALVYGEMDLGMASAYSNLPSPGPANVAPHKPPRPLARTTSTNLDMVNHEKETNQSFYSESTLEQDRIGDGVFQATIMVVMKVREISQEGLDCSRQHLQKMVKELGMAVRELLSAVDNELVTLPNDIRRKVEMIQKLVTSAFRELVTCLHSSQQFDGTTIEKNSRRNVLKNSNVLALNSKNLLDEMDAARTHGHSGNVGQAKRDG